MSSLVRLTLTTLAEIFIYSKATSSSFVANDTNTMSRACQANYAASKGFAESGSTVIARRAICAEAISRGIMP